MSHQVVIAPWNIQYEFWKDLVLWFGPLEIYDFIYLFNFFIR